MDDRTGGWDPTAHRVAYDELLAELRAQGFEVELTGLAAPVQLEGRLPSGERFYFRSRHDHCSLDVGFEHAGDPGRRSSEIDFGAPGHEDASYLPVADARRILPHLIATLAPSASTG